MKDNLKTDADPIEVIRTNTTILFNAGSVSYEYIESWVGYNYYNLPPQLNKFIFIVDDLNTIQSAVLTLNKYISGNWAMNDVVSPISIDNIKLSNYLYYNRGLRNLYFVTKDNFTITSEDGLGVEFDRLHEKDYSDRLIYGHSTLTEAEKAFIDAKNQVMAFSIGWKAPRTLDKVDRYEGESHYDYIGAPGGEEWLIPNTWEVSKMDDVDYDTMEDTYYKLDEDVVNKCAFMYPPVVDENVRLYDGKLVNMKDYYVSGIFDAQAAIQDGVPTSVVIKHVLENKYQEQLTKEMQDYDTWLLNQMISKGDGRTGIGLYSKLCNININKDQGDMFSYTNNNPAAKPWEERVKNQQDKSLRKNIQGSKPSDDFKAFEKLTNKLANKSTTYRPLPDCLTIKESSIDGLGIFTTEKIYLLGVRDPHVWKTHTLLVYNDDNSNKAEELLRSALGGHLNHSNNPNCTLGKISSLVTDEIIVEKYFLRPLKDIEADSELTLNYNKELCGLSGYDGAEFLKEY